METIIVALIGGIVTITLTALGYFGAKKSGLGIAQEKLIANLKDIAETNETKIQMLEADALEKDKRLISLEAEVKSLRKLTIKQARIITQLMNDSIEKRAFVEAELSE